MNELATRKLGFPSSFLASMPEMVNNEHLGIRSHSLANILINNVGDPYSPADTYQMEVKRYEVEVLEIVASLLGVPGRDAAGYVTSGGTEGNLAGLWWCKRWLTSGARTDRHERMAALRAQRSALEDELSAAAAERELTAVVAAAARLRGVLDVLADRKLALDPVLLCTTGHTHYSIHKSAELLCLRVVEVPARNDGAMDPEALERLLIGDGSAADAPSLLISANVGTTVTGAIDDVPEIRRVLARTRPSVPVAIHLDAALSGLALPVLAPFGHVRDYLGGIGACTMSISGHKWHKYLGIPQPCGLAVTTRAFLDEVFEHDSSGRRIEYASGIHDRTISGSRSGLAVLLLHNALHGLELHHGTAMLRDLIAQNQETAAYLAGRLEALYPGRVRRSRHGFNVILPRPPSSIAVRYQLMVHGDDAVACVLANVNRQLVDAFIADLTLALARDSGGSDA